MDPRDTLLRACADLPTVPEALWELVATLDGDRLASGVAVAFLERPDLPERVAAVLVDRFDTLGAQLRIRLWTHVPHDTRLVLIGGGELRASELHHAAKVVAEHDEAVALAWACSTVTQLEALLDTTRLAPATLTEVAWVLLERADGPLHYDAGEACGETLISAAVGHLGAGARDALVAQLSTAGVVQLPPRAVALWRAVLANGDHAAPWVRTAVDALLGSGDDTLAWLCTWATKAAAAPGGVRDAIADAAKRSADPTVRRAAAELTAAMGGAAAGTATTVAALRTAAAAGDLDAVRALLDELGSELTVDDADAVIASEAVPARLAWVAARQSRNAGLHGVALIGLRPDDAEFAGLVYACAPNDRVEAALVAAGTAQHAALVALEHWASDASRENSPVWEAAALLAGDRLCELSLSAALRGYPNSTTLAAAVTAAAAAGPALAVELGDTFAGTLAEFTQLLAVARS